nr:MAG TPA: hypothetical protein [Caudoviricetes sp.]
MVDRVENTITERRGRMIRVRLLILSATPSHSRMHASQSQVAQSATRIIGIVTEPVTTLSGKTAHNFVMRLVQNSKVRILSG